jgi:hypothetical protein
MYNNALYFIDPVYTKCVCSIVYRAITTIPQNRVRVICLRTTVRVNGAALLHVYQCYVTRYDCSSDLHSPILISPVQYGPNIQKLLNRQFGPVQ